MINITSNGNNANKNRLERNEPLTLTITLELNDIIKLVVGGVLLVTLIGIVIL